MSLIVNMLLMSATINAPASTGPSNSVPVEPQPRVIVSQDVVAPNSPASQGTAAPIASQPVVNHSNLPETVTGRTVTGGTVTSAPMAGRTVTATSTGDGSLLVIERNIVQRTNAERMRRGLRALRIDPQLMQSARRHAAWMAGRRVMQHGRAAVAENIAAGQGSSHEALHDWMNSSGHRANILNGQYSRIGAAAYRGADGQIYWCQQFLW